MLLTIISSPNMLPKVVENLRKSVKLKMKVVGVIVLLSVQFSGCASKLTLFTPPGKIDHQRDRAVLVDPFALPNMVPKFLSCVRVSTLPHSMKRDVLNFTLK